MGVRTDNQVTKTNFAAINDALVLDVTNLNVVRFEFQGTYNFTAVFEALGIDGTTWNPMQVVKVNTAEAVTSHSTANAQQAYEAGCLAVAKVRVRLTGFTSAGTHLVGIGGDSVSVEPSPTVQQALGGSKISLTTAASTNASNQKASAGNLLELTAYNPTATAAYLKLYNKATAPTVGTDVPVLTVPLPVTAPGTPPVALNFGQIGKRFSAGIGIAVTAAAVATDTGVTVAGIQIDGTYN